jgi:hypothetical protein
MKARNNTKTKKANRKLTNKLRKAKEELSKLQKLLRPFYQFHCGNYNNYRKHHPESMSLNEATNLLRIYWQETHPPISLPILIASRQNATEEDFKKVAEMLPIA